MYWRDGLSRGTIPPSLATVTCVRCRISITQWHELTGGYIRSKSQDHAQDSHYQEPIQTSHPPNFPVSGDSYQPSSPSHPGTKPQAKAHDSSQDHKDRVKPKRPFRAWNRMKPDRLPKVFLEAPSHNIWGAESKSLDLADVLMKRASTKPNPPPIHRSPNLPKRRPHLDATHLPKHHSHNPFHFPKSPNHLPGHPSSHGLPKHRPHNQPEHPKPKPYGGFHSFAQGPGKDVVSLTQVNNLE